MRFKFNIVSKDTSHCFQHSDFENIEGVDVQFIENNSISLPKLYNKLLDNDEKQYDFIVFMHGDAKFDIQKLISHLLECKDKYDVFGLCGTEVMNVSQSPLNWYTSSRPTPEKRWGCVTHGELGNQTSYFSAHHQNILDHEVACIDGVCIVFGPKALNSKMRFDEQFLWDQYDSDISLQCVLKYHLKLGVLVHTELQHYSVGKGILTAQFLEHEKDFRKKWNIELN